MFEDLDDPQGVPHDPDRLGATIVHARRLRARRRVVAGSGAAIAVALVASAVMMTSGGSGPRRPINVAAQPGTTSPSASDLQALTPETITTVDAVTTTTARPRPTTTTPRPATTTTTRATTATVPHYQLVARLSSDASSATGTAGADDVGSGSWRVTISASGLTPNLAHVTYIQGRNADGTRTEIRHVCDFTSKADGTGGCTATVNHGFDPAFVSLGAYDSRSNGYASVAHGTFTPS
jgi:hypothetical protein